MSHSRDITMFLNEISLRSGFTIKKLVALFVYCFIHYTFKWNEICKKSIYHVFLVWMGKSIPRASCSKPPKPHYALWVNFPIHARNTWNILIHNVLLVLLWPVFVGKQRFTVIILLKLIMSWWTMVKVCWTDKGFFICLKLNKASEVHLWNSNILPDFRMRVWLREWHTFSKYTGKRVLE